MALFISISSSSLAPFQCELHPNGQSTVQAYNQILCWSGLKHRDMVVVGVFLGVIPVSFIALSAWVVVQLPVRLRRGDTTFLHAFGFLFFRFKPAAFWYVVVVLLRNLAATLITIVPDEALQLFFCSL